jgi:plastocyanin
MNLHRIPLAVAATGLLAVVTACGSSSSGTASSGTASTPPAATAAAGGTAAATSGSTITIKNFAFGSPLTVKPGEKITVVNDDSAPHTVTSDDGTSFNAPADANGGTGTFTAPTKAGTYPYHCTVHPYMHGTLIVS